MSDISNPGNELVRETSPMYEYLSEVTLVILFYRAFYRTYIATQFHYPSLHNMLSTRLLHNISMVTSAQ